MRDRRPILPEVAERPPGDPSRGGARTVPLPEGRRALAAGDVATALAAARGRLARREDDPWALLLLGDALSAAGDADGALRAYGRAAPARLESSFFHLRLASGLRRHGRPSAAVEHDLRAHRLEPRRPEPLCGLGSTLAQLGRHAEAVPHLVRAARLAGGAAAEARLAAALEATNRLEEAERVVARLLGRAPDDPLANLVRALLDRRAGALDAARARLERLLAGAPAPDVEERVWSELALVHDRLGDPGATFRAASEARARAARSPRVRAVDRDLHPAFVARVRAWLRRAPVPREERPAGPPLAAPPVFVVGFPRSGTTLVEHVLGALPGFATSDEEPILDRIARGLPALLGRAARSPEDLGDLRPADLATLRATYLAAARDLTGDRGARLVDKNPWNLLHLPLVRRVFPESPIVVVLRDPRDACLSAFLQDFRPNVATVGLLTLEGTARSCREVLGAWLDMRTRVPALEVRYEDLVADFEGGARRLVRHAGAPWHPSVLAFHEAASRKAVSTPSRGDVARPVSERSVGRWRAYRPWLEPILPALDPLLEPLGYPR